MERLVALLRAGPAAHPAGDPHVYLVLLGSAADDAGLALAERLRAELPALSLQTNCGGGSVKSQFKRADRSGAGLALVLGEDELQRSEVGVKALRVPGSEQRQVKLDGLAQFLSAELGLDRS
jgi:histidyl-tRNA synthetase